MSGKKIEPKVPTTSVNKADKTKTEEERTSQRVAARKLPKMMP